MADWDACLAGATAGLISGRLLRLVESQEEIATTQLVSSLERQAMLEDLLEATKPRRRPGTERLHYLLATPFRYPPLKHGSRFGSRIAPSLFYGSLGLNTVLAEAAYYRFVFWHGMTVPPEGKLVTQHTMLEAEYRTKRGLQLHAPPFTVHRKQLTHPSDYAATQELGSKMRQTGIEAFEYISARDPGGGVNVALFTPDALPRNEPLSKESWLCELTGSHAKFSAGHNRTVHGFEVDLFRVSKVLPQPA
ncbi:MAG: RES family NAD+ phosphorylase [Rhizobium sp.]|nr:RES family NAD+ phosphorylase [Rhizobium sp.]